MTQNVLQIGPQLVGVIGGTLVLFLFALTVALPHRPKRLPGSSGHRLVQDQGEHEVIRPDGYIDSFSKEVEEAGGALPLVVRLALGGILLWWLAYLILNWTPR
jgi:hypothetical protein